MRISGGYLNKPAEAKKLTQAPASIVKNIQDGKIEGSLVKENGKMMLELPNGEKIEVKLQADVPLGKMLAFHVKNTPDGEVMLKLSNTNSSPAAENLVKNLNLPDTPEMRAVVDLFMSKAMTLEKSDLIKANFVVKNFNLSPEIVTNLAEKAMNLTSSELEIAKSLVKDGVMPLADKVSDLISNLPEEQKSQMSELIMQKFDVTEADKNLLKGATIDNTNTLSEPIEDKQQVSQNLQNTEDKPSLVNNLENIIKENKVMQDTSTENITKVVKDILLGKKFDINTTKLVDGIEDLEKMAKILEEVSESIKKESVKSEVKKEVEVVKQNVEVMAKMSESGNFELLSPLLHQKLEQGSIQFFEQKKMGVGKAKNSLYVVINLDLEALEHIELHLHKFDKVLDLQIYVENEKIKSYLTPHLSGLIKIADEEGFMLNKLLIDVADKEERPSVNTFIQNTRNFDFKI
ncbi:MAG: hypothetical protein BEN19_07315 [Epulopiscium sp. Nuni2H_MBin003]|nr:MAG: hypothetical protein BEN19_07315 [Epulopiscium sp. Nuni2H_MBin003]